MQRGDPNGAPAHVLMEQADRLERPIVGIVGRCVDVKGAGLLAVLLVQLRAVVRPDQVTEVFEQLDDGKSLLRRPVSGNGEGNCQERSGRGRAHDLVSVVRARLSFGVACGNAFGGWFDSGLRNDGPSIRIVMQ